ncbi:MAG TPA: biotin/lipoyl-containing protein [Pyrinomonadaceae bacterium]|nr:biotin/lipoyl-containing protein [Pyrinomonadaceae bacterium]
MKLIAEIDGEERNVEIRREGSRVVAVIDGREFEIEAHEIGSGNYLLKNGNSVYECRAGQSQAGRDSFEVYVGTDAFHVTLIDTKRLRTAARAGAHADGSAEIVAPMPGKVVRVIAEKGAQVEAGDGIVVVEAMKMQNEMKSPRAGTIIAINVQQGATVNAGDVLAVIE